MTKVPAPGLYTPRWEDLEPLAQGLAGGSEVSDFWGPSFFASPALLALFLQCFERCEALFEENVDDTVLLDKYAKEPLVHQLVDVLAREKALVMNHYALCKRLPRALVGNRPPAYFREDARNFTLDLLVQHANTVSFYQRCFAFNSLEQRLFGQFVARTAKALFVMGYPDAAHHCSQVGRLCTVKASLAGGSQTERMQAALVGWLHDPKFDVSVSIDNLSTHPVVASAIALSVLSHPDVKPLVAEYAESLGADWQQFVLGITDALSINNDSRFVAERFIFDQVAMQLVQQQGQAGKALREALWDRHQQRLSAPSRGAAPQPFQEELGQAISSTWLDSGLVGIKKLYWVQACEHAGVYPFCNQAYQEIVAGTFADRKAIAMISDWLIAKQSETQDVLHRWQVRGIHLFSHHDEVSPCGRVAALALVNSDPLLLSPHKILEVRQHEEPLIERLKSFIGSLDSNINDLPNASRESALSWQRSIFISVLKAAQDVTGLDRLTEFFENHRYTPMQTDVDDLRNLILEKQTWGEYAVSCMANGHQEKFLEALDRLKHHYLTMCREYREAAMKRDVDETKLN